MFSLPGLFFPTSTAVVISKRTYVSKQLRYLNSKVVNQAAVQGKAVRMLI